MTTSQAIISKIKEQINNEFKVLSFDEYEDLCCGDGTLAVLDRVLSDYEHIDFTDDEAKELAEHATKLSNNIGYRYSLYQISKDLAETITRAFNEDHRGIGRLKFWLDIMNYDLQGQERYHIDNYYQLLLELMNQRNLQENDLDEYANEYDLWLHQQMDSIMDGFAKACADGIYSIDEQDDWLTWLGGFDECTYQDIKYINLHWDEFAKIKYKRHTEHFKCYNIDTKTGEVINETEYCGTYEEALKQFVNKTVVIYKKDED